MPMHIQLRPATILTAFVTLAIIGPVAGQQSPPANGRAVKQAAFERSASGDGQQTVRFGRQATRVGDAVEQTIALEMRLTLSMRQANQLVGTNRTSVRTNQRRVMTTTEVDAGRATAISVHYVAATKQMTTADGDQTTAPADAADASSQSSPAPQSVQGKTYLCRREPGDNGKLIVTDEAGKRPPTDEYEIVAPQMEMVGRPNPLAQYLAGRTIAVGESIELPKEIAKQIFNLSGKFGDVTHFNLTLEKLQNESGAPSAVFRASVEAASSDATQMRMLVEGPLVVQIDTCRVARVALAGPIGMSETRGTYSMAYQVIGTGRLQMNIASAYRDSHER